MACEKLSRVLSQSVHFMSAVSFIRRSSSGLKSDRNSLNDSSDLEVQTDFFIAFFNFRRRFLTIFWGASSGSSLKVADSSLNGTE